MPGEEGDSRALIVNGDYHLEVQGDMRINTRGGGGVTIDAEGGESGVVVHALKAINLLTQGATMSLEADGLVGPSKITLAGGAMGTILLNTGPPIVGPRIEISPTKITLAVGPPVVGASIELDAEGITISYGSASFKLTPLGIQEQIAVNSRELSLLGHELKAAETTVKVGVEGLTTEAPISKSKVLAVAQNQATLVNDKVDGMDNSKASITIL